MLNMSTWITPCPLIFPRRFGRWTNVERISMLKCSSNTTIRQGATLVTTFASGWEPSSLRRALSAHRPGAFDNSKPHWTAPFGVCCLVFGFWCWALPFSWFPIASASVAQTDIKTPENPPKWAAARRHWRCPPSFWTFCAVWVVITKSPTDSILLYASSLYHS